VQANPQKLWLWLSQIAGHRLHDLGAFRTDFRRCFPNLRKEVHPEDIVYDFYPADQTDSLVP